MLQAASDFKTSPYGILILSSGFGGGGGGGGGGHGGCVDGGDGDQNRVPLSSSQNLPSEMAIAATPKAAKPPITPDCLPFEAFD